MLAQMPVCTPGEVGWGVLLTSVMTGYQGSAGKKSTPGHQGHEGFSIPRSGSPAHPATCPQNLLLHKTQLSFEREGDNRN